MTSSGDVFAPFMISTAIDVFEPNIEITKEVLDINGGLVELGDTLKFDLKVVNKGNDPATNVILHDSLYGAMDYVPGSLKINTGANTGVKTDVAGDDQAEFALSGGVNFVKFRLGSGANSTTGGNMGITAATDSLTTMEFKVTVTTDCQIFHCNSNIVNKAFVTFVGNISGASRSTYSSPTGFDQYGCPAIGPTTLVVNVPPCTPPADTSITACSPYPLSNILPFRPGYNQYYNSSWATITDATSTGTYYAIKQLYPGCNDTIQMNMTITCTLPVILSYFKGEYNNNAVKLQWRIETQSSFSHFEIERSTDGRNFSTIGNVALSGIDLYNFLDVNLVSGSIYYYRLKMIDTDGNFKYSNIVVVRMNGGKNQINIYPNPASDFVNAELGSNAKGDYSLQLIDATGRTVNTKIVTNAQSNQLITIQSGGLASGVYILKIVSRHYNETTLSKVIFK
ncbi:MAG: T9SS type A sorting domain-containing protein [Chitinophagaceae bacterium]|nr:T9SS type A sorting domain-containing protein [Chitinophagaceae bacterium]